MFHGYAIAKEDGPTYKKGQEGIITAYFPYGDDDPIAAVFFGEGNWITFKGWTEAEFLERFDIEKEESDNV